MSGEDDLEEAVDILQQLGLKEYEARCFVGLARLSTATAKELSELTDVPRTRIYDAIRVLEAEGLVEVQHSSPQRFRAVTVTEAIQTLRGWHDGRIERLRDTLDGLDRVGETAERTGQEVWTMECQRAIANRAVELISDATEEVVLVVGHESVVTEELIERLNGLDDVDLFVGVLSDSVREDIADAVPAATTFRSELEWLQPDRGQDELFVGRLLLVDRSSLLISTVAPDTGVERAIFGTGFGNGLVVIARRLIVQGLVQGRDPSSH